MKSKYEYEYDDEQKPTPAYNSKLAGHKNTLLVNVVNPPPTTVLSDLDKENHNHMLNLRY